mmetsp:Transcript_4324/g.10313  ORF Transcript_4324/g.10313 Transcript_4324/m.10313 type:complete len:211 (-) Transcript_4324:171-803(-)
MDLVLLVHKARAGFAAFLVTRFRQDGSSLLVLGSRPSDIIGGGFRSDRRRWDWSGRLVWNNYRIRPAGKHGSHLSSDFGTSGGSIVGRNHAFGTLLLLAGFVSVHSVFCSQSRGCGSHNLGHGIVGQGIPRGFGTFDKSIRRDELHRSALAWRLCRNAFGVRTIAVRYFKRRIRLASARRGFDCFEIARVDASARAAAPMVLGYYLTHGE